MKTLLLFGLALSAVLTSNAQAYRRNEPLAHTFSIVARDPNTGEMGVAVQSHWFSVGTVVSWGEAGVGVVATQSLVNVSFGPRGLDLMRQGMDPATALKQLLEDDEGRNVRQVALLDTQGRVAVHTGQDCIAYASHDSGEGFSVQANMMLNDKVVPAMKAAWLQHDKLPLAERLIEVLKAAQAAGGDIRGKQSAALLVVRGQPTGRPWEDRLIDLRVDDGTEPIAELERLLRVHRAYTYMNLGDYHIEHGDMPAALEAYGKAMEMFPENLEMKYWTAVALASRGETDKAAAMLREVYEKDANWRELTRRLPDAGILNLSQKEFEKLVR
ncbi:MAG: DUF1028 domain-containing protein [Bacteroidota bacterium]|jgi:uncharacterized Ntn-hydrolase superfamily protein